MSAISTLLTRLQNTLSTLRAAIWAIDVRDDIADAIEECGQMVEQCYSDVSNPTLQTEALEAALQNKIDQGEMAALTIGDGTITAAKLANGVIPAADATLTTSGGYADAAETGRQIGNINESLSNVQADLEDLEDAVSGISGGLTTEIKNALLDLLDHVAYEGTDGQSYYDALVTEFDNAAEAESIAVTFSGTNETFYDTDSLDVLRDYLTVTATFESGRTRTVTDYRLTGSMSIGTNTITVSYSGQTATFSVTVVWGYKLRTAFTGTGSNSLETHKGVSGGNKYTIAIEISYGAIVSGGVNFIFGNRTNGQPNYLGLQYQYKNWGSSPYYYYTWGVGIEEIKNCKDKTFRFVHVFDMNSDASTATITAHGRNVTDGTDISANTKSYTNEAMFTDDMVIGQQLNDSTTHGFNGTVSQFIFEAGEWSANKISAFLAGVR